MCSRYSRCVKWSDEAVSEGMFVGSARFHLRLPESSSLKDRRRVLRSIIDQLRSKYGVSAAEVGSSEVWQRAEIGVACVSNTHQQVESVLDQVYHYVERRLDVELLDVERAVW